MGKFSRFKIWFFAFFVVAILSSCSAPSFYAKNYQFNQSVASGHLDKAESLIIGNKYLAPDGRNRFLYYTNAGVVAHLKGKYVESNAFFEKADLFIEDYKTNFAQEGASFLLNPNISVYRGEDHEVLLINYYKALNYYLLGEKNEALVEVRRLNLRLNQLSEKYKSEKKYQQDAFMHVLMGLIYESNKNYNDAFIAYRNAYDIYENDYSKQFGLNAPDQLKDDLIRSAALGGLPEEKRQYEKLFNRTYSGDDGEANLVLLWNNGMGPVKDEWGINFAIVQIGEGWVSFVNEEYGMTFPIYIGKADLHGLTWIKVVFPKYVQRKMLFTQANLSYGGKTFKLELAEDINAISFKVLNERMLREFSVSLARVALKQAAAYEIGQANGSSELGAVLSIVASASESADTRNWQTIPHSIYYKRVPVKSGIQTVDFEMYGEKIGAEKHSLQIDIKKGETLIYPFFSLGAYEPVLKKQP